MGQQDHRLGGYYAAGITHKLHVHRGQLPDLDEAKDWLKENARDSWDIMWDMTILNWKHHYIVLLLDEHDAILFKLTFA